MTIDKNKVVSLNYHLSVREEGQTEERFAEKTDSAHPLVFIFGTGNLLEDFEKHLKGKKVGETFDFTLNAKQGYGEINKDYVIDLPIEAFKNEKGEVDRTVLVAGKTLPMRDNEGNHMQGTIKEVGLSTVKMDFNHPLAGHHLHFVGEVLEIRPATEEELDHGHVHGPGGHHH